MRNLFAGSRRACNEAQTQSREEIRNLKKDGYYEYKTWDMCDNHPRYRQLQLDANYMYDDLQNAWKKKTKMAVYKGSAKKWTVLDNSHTLESRNQLQQHIGDARTVTDSLPEGQGTSAVEVRRETMFVDERDDVHEIELPLRTQYV